MALLTIVVFLTIFTANVNCDLTIGQLAEDIIAEITAILLGLPLTALCGPPQNSAVTFLLYRVDNPQQPIILDQSHPIEIDSNKPVIMLVHGWMSSANATSTQQLKDAYLQRLDCNLIILNWSVIAAQTYTMAYCEVPHVGELAAKFLCALSDQGVALSEVHLVGHSLGAHVSGFAGKKTTATCGQVLGRITGLDPAGPLYETAVPSQRLNATDALSVDIIHTNKLQFGIAQSIGTVDFYPNCGGTVQPGCFGNINILNIGSYLYSDVSCSHSRAWGLMIESVNPNNNYFLAKGCATCPNVCTYKKSSTACTVMGEDCPTNPACTKCWLPTNGNSPFAEGSAPYSSGCA